MKNIKKFFETPKKVAISVVCIVAILAVLGTVTVFAAGSIAEHSAIGEENAQNFAFADAGVDPVSAQEVKTEFAFKQGQFVYEVEFVADGTEYEYWIKASDGAVVKKQTEIISYNGLDIPSEATLTQDSAKEIALADADLTADEVTFTEAKLKTEDGISVYEIEFYTANFKYEYEVNANTGAIYSKSKETHPLTSAEQPTETPDQQTESQQPSEQPPVSAEQTSPANQISLDTAKATALADAGVSASEVTYTKAKQDYDDGVLVFDIEFYTSTHKYDYEINALTGAVQSREAKAFASGSGDTGSNGNSSAYIGVDKAKSIALSHAGFSDSDVTFSKAKLEKDDGYAVYEIEFYTSTHKYDYEINALTGAVQSREAEAFASGVGNSGNNGNSSAYIGVDKAKSIALNHAGFSDSDVTFSKAKLENDDGYTVYEIEFYKDGTEYEYTINASTGDIMDFDVDRD